MSLLTVDTDIRSALVEAVKACLPDLPTAFENLRFDKPQPGSPWAAMFLLPVNSTVETLGDGGFDLKTGILQLDLNYPLLSGEYDQLVSAGKIAAYFKAGNRFSYGGHQVMCVSCNRSRGREVAGYWKVSVSVVWRAFAQRV